MNLDQLIEIVPGADKLWGEVTLAEMPKWGIAGMKREAAFIAHVAHETTGLTKFEESLNYSARRLMAVWPRRFPDMVAARAYEHNPEALANRVYANRMGNCGPETGDGWRYRGRGLPMLTGRDAYRACGRDPSVTLPLEDKPDFVLTPKVGVLAGCWFWRWKGMAALADAGDFESLTLRWNGGFNGLREREELYGKALAVLA